MVPNYRSRRCLAILIAIVQGITVAVGADPAKPVKKPGVSNPSVRIPIERLVPEAIYPVPGTPDWLAIDNHAWVSSAASNLVARMDPTTNSAPLLIPVGKEPGSGLVAAFGSLWVPNCGDSTMSRIDLATGKITTTFPMTFASDEGGIAAGAGSLWVMTDVRSTLSRLDPTNNQVVAEIRLPRGSSTVAFGENSVFVTSTEESLLTRVDPKSNRIVERIKVGPKPRFLAVGEGAVWTLNQGDGSISRVDIQSNKVIATIEAGIPGGGGEIAVGEGSVWATAFDYPITRIDPARNRVVQQFYGPGGDAIRVGQGFVWLSNLRQGNVWRLDPRRIEATRAE